MVPEIHATADEIERVRRLPPAISSHEQGWHFLHAGAALMGAASRRPRW
jgi:hypothetical protein